MTQHPIDLMPEAIRQRNKAGAREARMLLAAALVVCAVIVVSTHSWFSLMHAQVALFDASTQADSVYAAEARAAELQGDLIRTREFITLYERIAPPLEVSAVIATVVNNLPPSVTLDQLDIDAGARAITRSPRSKGPAAKQEIPPRVLNGELSGFAVSDQQIAELVARLDQLPPFQDVSLDFSRAREVRPGQLAREFRLSFRIDLDARYDVAYVHDSRVRFAAEEADHARQ